MPTWAFTNLDKVKFIGTGLVLGLLTLIIGSKILLKKDFLFWGFWVFLVQQKKVYLQHSSLGSAFVITDEGTFLNIFNYLVFPSIAISLLAPLLVIDDFAKIYISPIPLLFTLTPSLTFVCFICRLYH